MTPVLHMQNRRNKFGGNSFYEVKQHIKPNFMQERRKIGMLEARISRLSGGAHSIDLIQIFF